MSFVSKHIHDKHIKLTKKMKKDKKELNETVPFALKYSPNMVLATDI